MEISVYLSALALALVIFNSLTTVSYTHLTLPKALFGEFLITRIVNELKITKASASAERYTEISINY